MDTKTVNNGLTQRDVETLYCIFQKYPEVKLVYIFGSRAKGNYKQGSDIDFAIMNEGIKPDTITHIRGDIDESSLPYFVDILDYPKLSHKELKEHIDRVGIEFYNRDKQLNKQPEA